jgi:hypothetical protein
MFKELKSNVSDNTFDIKLLTQKLDATKQQLKALEDYLDIEYITYPKNSQYIKSTKCTKL